MHNQGFRLYKTGSSKELILEEIALPPLAEDEVRIKHQTIGVNFIDIYFRSGVYPVNLPATLGMEGMGQVLEVGKQVKAYQEGDLVGYAFGSMGAYQKLRNIKERFLFPIPKAIPSSRLAGNLLRGFTAEYLIDRIAREKMNLQAGDTVLFYAATGGVGLIALEWLRHYGVKVIATVGSEEKAQIAREYKADLVLRHDFTDGEVDGKVDQGFSKKDFLEQVQDFTGGKGVKVVFDSLGKDTFDLSLDCLEKRGMLISYGNATGTVDPFPPTRLSQKGSLFLTRPSLADYYRDPEEIKKYSKVYFTLVEKNVLTGRYSQQFDFSSIPEAHDFLEAKKSIGPTWIKVN